MPRAVSIHGGRDLRGGAVYRRKLQTDYRPYAAPGCEPEVEISNGDPILLEHWKHEGRQTRGTVIGLHGFAMGRPALDAVALFARQWYDRGLDVALMTLPHHGRRSGADARFSGEHFAVPHVGRLAEAVREAIYEILVVRNWLRDESDGPVGLMGLSLGGYLTSLAVGLCDDFDFAVPMVPPACMGDLAWRVFRTTRHGPRSGAPAIGEAELRSGFRVHSPLAHSLRVPKERILIVAGRGDRIVPPEHPTALWEHWEQAADPLVQRQPHRSHSAARAWSGPSRATSRPSVSSEPRPPSNRLRAIRPDSERAAPPRAGTLSSPLVRVAHRRAPAPNPTPSKAEDEA